MTEALEATIANAVEDLLDDVGTRSKQTRVTYRSAMTWLLRYFDEAWGLTEDSSTQEITLEVLLGFPGWLAQQTYLPYAEAEPVPLGASTRQLYLIAVGQFAQRALIRRIVPYDYTDLTNLKREYSRHAKKPVTPIGQKTPTKAVIKAVLKAVERRPEAPENASLDTKHRVELTWLRNRAIIYAFISSGARVSEMAGLKVADLTQEDGQWGAWITGKRQRTRFLAFGPTAWQAIQIYLQTRADSPAQRKHAPLFCRHDKRVKPESRVALGVRAYQFLVKDIEKDVEADLGYPVNLTPHKFRHYFARNFLNVTQDLPKLQGALGHSSLAVTGVYTEVGAGDVAKAVVSAEPIEALQAPDDTDSSQPDSETQI